MIRLTGALILVSAFIVLIYGCVYYANHGGAGIIPLYGAVLFAVIIGGAMMSS